MTHRRPGTGSAIRLKRARPEPARPASARFPLAIIPRAVLAVTLVAILAVAAAGGLLAGCRPADAPAGGEPELLWAWPEAGGAGGAAPDAGAGGSAGGSADSSSGGPASAPDTTPGYSGTTGMAFFRFSAPVEPGTYACSVAPETPFTLSFAGEMIVVRLDAPLAGETEVNLLGEGGAVVATAVVPPGPTYQVVSPSVSVSEGRERTGPGDGTEGLAGESSGPLTDGSKLLVGFGDIVADVYVPLGVTESELRAAVTLDPLGDEARFVPDWNGVNVLEIRWRGVPELEHEPFPVPAKVRGTSSAPASFALEMSLAIDASKLPVFEPLAGKDRRFTVAVSRAAAPSFTVTGLDNPSLTLPYGGYRTIYHAAPEPQRLRFAFTAPMDRASVERALVAHTSAGMPDPVGWTFAWKNDKTLDVTVTPPPLIPYVASINPVGAQDKQGLDVWFTENLVLGWSKPLDVVQVSTADPTGPGEAVVAAPPGVDLTGWSAGRDFLLGLEAFNMELVGDGETHYHPWVYSASTGGWTNLGALTPPWRGATWLDGSRVFVDRPSGWEVYDAAAGQPAFTASLDTSRFRLLAARPDPTGERVAVLTTPVQTAGTSPDATYPVSLTICPLTGDPAGQIVPEAAGATAAGAAPGSAASDAAAASTSTGATTTYPDVTRLAAEEYYYLVHIPLVWLPGGDGLLFTDRLEDGSTRLARLDLATGEVSAVAGSEGVSRWRTGMLAAFTDTATGHADCVFATETPDHDVGDLVVIDLATGEARLRVREEQLKIEEEGVERAIPSPTGRYLALAGITQTVLVDLAAPATSAAGDGTPEVMGENVEGVAVGFTADGEFLEVARAEE